MTNIASLLLFVGITSAIAAQQTQKETVSGHVLDPSDNKIVGVRVEAYRQSQLLGTSSSNSNGEYSISFDAGPPVDTVRYDQSDWYPGTVENISGKNNHTVHKILYGRGQKLSTFEAEDVICTFERIVEIDAKNDTRQKSLTQYKYREALDEIEKLSLPPELRERIKQIKRKYGIPVTPTSQPPA